MSQGVAVRRVRALDGLRGAAVAGVLLFHGGHLTGGFLGVDMFFVLSGFLITSLLLAESGSTGSIALGAFWARRARRLLPALAGLMVGIAVYCVVFAAPSELGQIRGDAVATLGYVANWRAVGATQDYWALFRAPSPLQHTWSLAIEEQFYLIWPLVFVGLLLWWKRAAAKAVLVTALVAAGGSSLLMALLYVPANTNRAYYGADTRAAAILLGVALAAALTIWGPVRGRVGRWALELAGVAGIAVLAVAWTRLSGQSATLYRGGLLACGLATVAVLAAAAHPEAGPISRVFSFRPLCLLGLISYGVYLWHWPIYVVVDEGRTGWSGWFLVAVRVALTLVVAIASYLVIEQPVRRGAIRARTWRVAIPVIATGLVLVLVVATNDAQPTPSAADTRPDATAAAVEEAAARPRATRVMVVGNSVAYSLGVGLKELQTNPPLVVFDAAVINCAFPWGIAAPPVDGPALPPVARCDKHWKNAVARFRPQVVLVILQCCSSPYRFGKRSLAPCDADYAPMALREYDRALATLGSTGARIILTTAPYTAKEQVSRPARASLDCSNRIRADVARQKGVQIVDLLGWTCPEPPRCREAEQGVVLRPDTVHFSGEGAHIAGRWLLREAQVTHAPVAG